MIFFIDGPGGTGKTFLYRALLAHLRSKKLIAFATATSGVDAAIMSGGKTSHSRFRIPIDSNESSECTISKQSGAADLLRIAQLILWDEAPMAKRWATENVDKLLKDVMGNKDDFGGKIIVFGGDFRQVLPVVREARTFSNFDEAINDTNNYYEEDFLNSLTPNGLPPHKLVLKRNCPIILLKNLDPSNGLCNGTRMVCWDFRNNVIDAEIVLGQHSGKHVFIPRIPLSPVENEGYPFQFRRIQFPIRLCFAMTINKAQGQILPNVGVYLPQSVFSHGQLYVSLSRGTSMSTTKALIKPDHANGRGDSKIKNIVYKQVLSAGTNI
ncbi:hypothetical protein DH2020_015788 [Rehmannia glutinosa]|uniref:ATP-dependent DNA helicase n=1 Tax=Rehmannia glutinosa TaxID=99300 RepID=A0ABR0WW83_REHGL